VKRYKIIGKESKEMVARNYLEGHLWTSIKEYRQRKDD